MTFLKTQLNIKINSRSLVLLLTEMFNSHFILEYNRISLHNYEISNIEFYHFIVVYHNLYLFIYIL